MKTVMKLVGAFAFVLLTACGSGSKPKEGSAGALQNGYAGLSDAMNEALSVASAAPGGTALNGAAPTTNTFQGTKACKQGGSVSYSGTITSDVSIPDAGTADAGTSLSYSVDFTGTFNNCNRTGKLTLNSSGPLALHVDVAINAQGTTGSENFDVTANGVLALTGKINNTYAFKNFSYAVDSTSTGTSGQTTITASGEIDGDGTSFTYNGTQYTFTTP